MSMYTRHRHVSKLYIEALALPEILPSVHICHATKWSPRHNSPPWMILPSRIGVRHGGCFFWDMIPSP